MNLLGRHPGGRAALLAPAGLSLLMGLWLATRLVTDSSATAADADRHGVLMVLGFLGTLIALERAVALRALWGYAAPVLLGLAGLTLVAQAPISASRVLLILGTAAYVGVLAALSGRQGDAPTTTQVLGATLALGAAVLWARIEISTLLPWLVGYIVLTIVAERVELARLSLPSYAGAVLIGLATLLLGSVMAATLWPNIGSRVFGLTLLVLVGWMSYADVARRTIRSTGLPRFAAAAMFCGYAWLAVAGATWLIGGAPANTRVYDTVVHASFLGFAMSMVMAHAPVILPAVLRIPLPYRAVLWVPLVVLQVGLALRIALGNGLGNEFAWRTGSLVTVAALLVFVATAVGCAVSA